MGLFRVSSWLLKLELFVVRVDSKLINIVSSLINQGGRLPEKRHSHSLGLLRTAAVFPHQLSRSHQLLLLRTGSLLVAPLITTLQQGVPHGNPCLNLGVVRTDASLSLFLPVAPLQLSLLLVDSLLGSRQRLWVLLLCQEGDCLRQTHLLPIYLLNGDDKLDVFNIIQALLFI